MCRAGSFYVYLAACLVAALTEISWNDVTSPKINGMIEPVRNGLNPASPLYQSWELYNNFFLLFSTDHPPHNLTFVWTRCCTPSNTWLDQKWYHLCWV